MKIGIINVNEALTPNGGVRMQGVMWHDGLVAAGCECDLIDFWKVYDWSSFDAIIVLGYGGFLRNVSKGLRPLCKKMALAPIIDPKYGTGIYKFFTKYWGFHKHTGLTTRFHDLYLASKYYDLFLTRSDFESMYVNKCLDVPKSKIKIVPLQVRTPMVETIPEKENFILHVSRLASWNKNVPRLIEAAIKYGFQLKLAGFLNGDKEKQWLHGLIDGHDNIEYVGEVSDEKLIALYDRAKVFALPSLLEGVGMVALEAAGRGCEVVLTNDGAPKEYYHGLAYLVNPKSVDDIGQKCMEALEHGNKQPALLKLVRTEYSPEACTKKLIDALS